MRSFQRPADSALIGRNQRTTRAAYSLYIQYDPRDLSSLEVSTEPNEDTPTG